MENSIRGLVVGGHDGSFLILHRVGSVDAVIGVRSHTGEVASVYLMDANIEKLVEFLSRKANNTGSDCRSRSRLAPRGVEIRSNDRLRLLARHDRDDFKRNTEATPLQNPLLEKPRVVAPH